MRHGNLIARSACVAGLLIAAASPAVAQGKADRARTAIAEASAKIDAANKIGASGEVPRLQAEAQAALRTAKEDLSSGRKEEAIAAANHASELADMALGESHKRQMNAAGSAQADAAATAAAAQQDAAAANARADNAEQAAASAAADAAAARNAPPVLAVAPPAATTTVTTETTKAVAPRTAVKRRVVHRTTARQAARTPVATEKTTTTVTTN